MVSEGQPVVDGTDLVPLAGRTEVTQVGFIGLVVGTDKQGVAGFEGESAVLGIDVAGAACKGKGDARQAGRHPCGRGRAVAPCGVQQLHAVAPGLLGQQKSVEETDKGLQPRFPGAHGVAKGIARDTEGQPCPGEERAQKSPERAARRTDAEMPYGQTRCAHGVAASRKTGGVQGIDTHGQPHFRKAAHLMKDKGFRGDRKPEQHIAGKRRRRIRRGGEGRRRPGVAVGHRLFLWDESMSTEKAGRPPERGSCSRSGREHDGRCVRYSTSS